MKLVRSIATISGYTALSRILGFLREIIMASYLGASLKSDALVVAIKLPSIIRRLFAEGAFNSAFVPIFTPLLNSKDPKESVRFAEEVLSILVVSLTGIILIAEIFMPHIMRFIVPGFAKTPERFDLVVQFMRITFPFILLIFLAALYGGILNSLERFVAVASSPVIGNMSILGTIFILVGLSYSPEHAFAFSALICGFVQLLWVFVPTYHYKIRLRLKWPQLTPNVKKFFMLIAPAAAGSGIVQINILIDTFMASLLPEGGISYLHYADRLNQLPLSMLGASIGTALLPLISKKISLNDQQGIIDSQNLALEYALLFVLPATLGLIILAYPLMEIFFEHGDFSSKDTLASAQTLKALALGLPAYIMIKIFSSPFFARQDVKTPLLFAIISVGMNIGLSLLLIHRLHYVGLALSTAISAWINVGFLIFALRKKGYFSLSPRLKKFLPRLFFAGLLTFCLTKVLFPYFSFIMSRLELKFLEVFVLVGITVGGYILCARLTGALDIKDLKQQLRAA